MILGDLVPVDVAFDPWPAELFGSVSGDLNWVWNASGTVTAALCPIPPISKPLDRTIVAPAPRPMKKAKVQALPLKPKPTPKVASKPMSEVPWKEQARTRRRPVAVEVPEAQTVYRPVIQPYMHARPTPVFGLPYGGFGGGQTRPYPFRVPLRPYTPAGPSPWFGGRSVQTTAP